MDVLICDDDDDVRLLLEMSVRLSGHTARSVTRADDAAAVCRDGIPDVLLLDVSMPDKDGPTLLEELRAERLEPPHTVLVSAITREELEAVASRLGVDWISKPFVPADIRAKLAAA